MSNDKRKLAEDLMVDIMYGIAEGLLTKINAGSADSKDISNAIKLLQNNGITVAVKSGNPMGVLKEDLPFHSDYTVVN